MSSNKQQSGNKQQGSGTSRTGSQQGQQGTRNQNRGRPNEEQDSNLNTTQRDDAKKQGGRKSQDVERGSGA
jgi:hypothetical protein